MVALRDLTGVNALAPSQQLTFGDAGITIIYGHNASGKSGYARVIKTAVGARVREDVLGDVFASSGPTSQSAVIEYRVAGTSPAHEWKWPGSAANPQLRQVHLSMKPTAMPTSARSPRSPTVLRRLCCSTNSSPCAMRFGLSLINASVKWMRVSSRCRSYPAAHRLVRRRRHWIQLGYVILNAAGAPKAVGVVRIVVRTAAKHAS